MGKFLGVINFAGGYGMCLNRWILDSRIQGELGLLCALSSLTAKTGVCTASNKWLSDALNVHEVSISRKIGKLKKLGYIDVSYKRRGCEIEERYITFTNNNLVPRLTDELTDDYQNDYSTINENVKVKSISNKSTSIKKKKEKFIPPTLEEIEAYCKERKNNVDAKKFFEYYSENEWKDKFDNPVQNWKLKMIASWERNRADKVAHLSSKPQTERHEPTEEELLEFRRKRLQEIAEWNERNKGR